MLLSACRQGCYAANEITVLTPYNGQLRLLLRLLEQEGRVFVDEADQELLQPGVQLDAVQGTSRKDVLSSVRLATVDNFQGLHLLSCLELKKVMHCLLKTAIFLPHGNRIMLLFHGHA